MTRYQRCDIIMGMSDTQDMAATIRAAFRKSGLSILALTKRADVQYASTHGFLCGDKDIRLSTATKLAGALGLRLVADKRKGR